METINFEDILKDENLLRGIYAYGFENPSNIQSKAIPYILEGRDIIAQSQSGTGKTGAFLIGALSTINFEINDIQKLILAPTHELAIQIYTIIKELSKYLTIKIELIIGKTSIKDSIQKLQSSPHIVIGTPGRILDMIHRKQLFTSNINSLILDEADEILSQGFLDNIYNIIRSIPSNTQICLFSATIPNDIMTLTENFMNNPLKILVNNQELTLEGITQFYINTVNYNWKYDTILDLYNKLSINQCIIYINTKNILDRVYNSMMNDKFPVMVISSDLSSSDRKQTLDKFRSGECRILLSTDLLSRGIDIQQLSLVINYDIPNDKSTYIHRIGRSGRYGRKGVAINLVSKDEIHLIDDLQKFYNTQIKEMPENIDSFF